MKYRLKENVSCVTVGTARIEDHEWRDADSFGNYLALEKSGFIESEESVKPKAEKAEVVEDKKK